MSRLNLSLGTIARAASLALAAVLLAPGVIHADALPLYIADPTANEKPASGDFFSLGESNVKRSLTLAAEKRWGNDYMHARYYSPNLGRFLSVDPVGGTVGSSQSWNRHSYVLNNPISFIDPDGRDVVVAVRPVESARAWGHAYLVVTPTGENRTSERFAGYLRGKNRFTLSGGPGERDVDGRTEFNRLVSHVTHPMDEMGDATKLFAVPPPEGMSMEEFERRVLAAFESYESGSLHYNNTDADFHGKNSNAFAAGMLDAAGVDLDSLLDVEGLWMFGWGDPVDMDSSAGNEGDSEAWLAKMKQEMANRRAE